MSIEQATAFIEDILKNPGMREDIEKCMTIEERLSLAKSIGYGFRIDDVMEISGAFNSSFQKAETSDSMRRKGKVKSKINNCCVYNPEP